MTRYQWGTVDRCYFPHCCYGGTVDVPVTYWQEGVRFSEVRGYCVEHAHLAPVCEVTA